MARLIFKINYKIQDDKNTLQKFHPLRTWRLYRWPVKPTYFHLSYLRNDALMPLAILLHVASQTTVVGSNLHVALRRYWDDMAVYQQHPPTVAAKELEDGELDEDDLTLEENPPDYFSQSTPATSDLRSAELRENIGDKRTRPLEGLKRKAHFYHPATSDLRCAKLPGGAEGSLSSNVATRQEAPPGEIAPR